MASMSYIVLSLVMLVAGCYSAPANLLDIGGTVGFDSVMNGTIGGHANAERDGLSVKGGANGIVAASWVPTLIAKGHAGVGEMLVAGDASLKTKIDNSWQPGFTGELGRTSKGVWVAGFQPTSLLNSTLLVTPNLQLKTGDDARKLLGQPLASDMKFDPNPQLDPDYFPYAPPNYYPMYMHPYYQQYFQQLQYPTMPFQQQVPLTDNSQFQEIPKDIKK